jgi:Double zinc ribbon
VSLITPPGQGCGHELRPGTQFCTVCGTPAVDDGRRTAVGAEEQTPAPGQEVTAIRPVPAQPEPVTPTSPATITDRPGEREGRRFCGRCGHELKPAVRFCGACGHSVPDSIGQDAARGSAEDLRAEPRQAPDLPAYAQTITAAPTSPAPPPPPPPPPATGEGWGSGAVLPGAADRAVSGQGGPSPFQAPPGARPPVRAAPARRPRRAAVGWPLAVALAVLVAAGGTAAGLLLTRHPGHSRLSSSQSQASPQHRITSVPSTTPSTSGTTTAPSPPSPPMQISSQGVTIGIGAVNTDSDAIDVADTLAAYFGGIDTRNYTQAWDTFTPSVQAGVPLQSFSSEVSTSRDSQVVVRSLQHDPNGDIDAKVTFQSHQAGQYGPNPGETCTNWSLDYQLVPSSGGQPSSSGSASLSYLINTVKTVGAGHASC